MFCFYLQVAIIWGKSYLFWDKNQCYHIVNIYFQYGWGKKSGQKWFVIFISELLISCTTINSSWISLKILFSCLQLSSQWLFQHLNFNNNLIFQSLNKQPHSTKINEVLSKTLYHLVYRELDKPIVFLFKRQDKVI